jgi:carbon monoxide dehydrogenase subunit G
VRVRERIDVARPPDDVYAALKEPQDRGDEGAWRDLAREDGAYRAKLRVAGPVDVEFDCRFELEEEASQRILLRGVGTSPRLSFTFEGSLSIRGSNQASTVDVDVEVLPAGSFTGLGQRRIREEAHRLIADFVSFH